MNTFIVITGSLNILCWAYFMFIIHRNPPKKQENENI